MNTISMDSLYEYLLQANQKINPIVAFLKENFNVSPIPCYLSKDGLILPKESWNGEIDYPLTKDTFYALRLNQELIVLDVDLKPKYKETCPEDFLETLIFTKKLFTLFKNILLPEDKIFCVFSKSGGFHFYFKTKEIYNFSEIPESKNFLNGKNIKYDIISGTSKIIYAPLINSTEENIFYLPFYFNSRDDLLYNNIMSYLDALTYLEKNTSEFALNTNNLRCFLYENGYIEEAIQSLEPSFTINIPSFLEDILLPKKVHTPSTISISSPEINNSPDYENYQTIIEQTKSKEELLKDIQYIQTEYQNNVPFYLNMKKLCSFFILSYEPAIEGQAGNDTITLLIGYALNFCLDLMFVTRLIKLWNKSNIPPFTEEEIEAKIESIYKSRQTNRPHYHPFLLYYIQKKHKEKRCVFSRESTFKYFLSLPFLKNNLFYSKNHGSYIWKYAPFFEALLIDDDEELIIKYKNWVTSSLKHSLIDLPENIKINIPKRFQEDFDEKNDWTKIAKIYDLMFFTSINAKEMRDLAIKDIRTIGNDFIKDIFDITFLNIPVKNEEWLEDFCAGIYKNTTHLYYIKFFFKFILSLLSTSIFDNDYSAEDVFFIIVGPQGKMKSALCRKLAVFNRFHLECTQKLNSYETQIAFPNKLIITFSELLSLKGIGNVADTIKAITTGKDINIRFKYQTKSVDLMKRAILFGTTNKFDFIQDETGNRRYYILEITDDMQFDYDFFDLNYLTALKTMQYLKKANAHLKDDNPYSATFLSKRLQEMPYLKSKKQKGLKMFNIKDEKIRSAMFLLLFLLRETLPSGFHSSKRVKNSIVDTKLMNYYMKRLISLSFHKNVKFSQSLKFSISLTALNSLLLNLLFIDEEYVKKEFYSSKNLKLITIDLVKIKKETRALEILEEACGDDLPDFRSLEEIQKDEEMWANESNVNQMEEN